jgi:hypothetical protein
MKDLIEALSIVQQYILPGSYAETFPTNCDHDVLYVYGIEDWKAVSHAHKSRLGKLGFTWDKDEGHLYSFKFGSC